MAPGVEAMAANDSMRSCSETMRTGGFVSRAAAGLRVLIGFSTALEIRGTIGQEMGSASSDRTSVPSGPSSS